MSRAKVKVTIRPKSGKGTGMLLARVPIRVEQNDHPNGQKLYQTKAQASVRISTTRGGKPRVKRTN